MDKTKHWGDLEEEEEEEEEEEMEEEIEEEELEAGIESVDSLSRYCILQSVLYKWAIGENGNSIYLDTASGQSKACHRYLVLNFFFFCGSND